VDASTAAVIGAFSAVSRTPSDQVRQVLADLLTRTADRELPTPDAGQVHQWWEQLNLRVTEDLHLSAWRAQQVREDLRRGSPSVHGLPDARTWAAWTAVDDELQALQVHQWLAEQAGTTVPLSQMSAQQIDTTLAGLWSQVERAEADRHHAAGRAARARRDLPGQVEVAEKKLAEAQQRLQARLDATEPYEGQFLARGGWSRYFRVVTSGAGHVHSSRACRTCFTTTRYQWVPALSGLDATEVVDLYGSEMCAVCFPGVVGTDAHQREGRLARERAEQARAAKAVRAAAVAEKSITAADGSTLQVHALFTETIRTAVTAQRVAVDRVVELTTFLSEEAIAAAETPEHRRHMQLWRERAVVDLQVLLAALAAKRGTEVDVQDELVRSKAARRVRAAGRRG
jgi:hypothetical protein